MINTGELQVQLESFIGPAGPQGAGVPAGGVAGQVLAKASDADQDTAWIAPSELMEIDTSLSQEGKAAEAKAVGEELDALSAQMDQVEAGLSAVQDYDMTADIQWDMPGYYLNGAGLLEAQVEHDSAYIEVNEGETYIITAPLVYWQRLCTLCDADKAQIISYPPALYRYPYELVTLTVTIPSGCAYLIVTTLNTDNKPNMGAIGEFKLLRRSSVPIESVQKTAGAAAATAQTALSAALAIPDRELRQRIIDNQLRNDFAWADFDGLYATMTFDDANADIDLLEDLAESLGIPLCFAAIPSKLDNACTNGETVREVLGRAVENGGEVLAHWGTPLNAYSTDQAYIDVYVGAKKALTEAGFEIRGIITAGGGEDGTPESYKTQDWEKGIALARIYYQYADLVANNYGDVDNRGIEQFSNSRTFTDGGLDDMKAKIDAMAATGKGWLNMASHGTNHENTASVSVFREIFEYAISKGFSFVTWKQMYEKFGSSKLEERLKALESS